MTTTLATNGRDMHVDSRASKEWALRPDDQRYLDLDSLAAYVKGRRERSHVAGLALQHLDVVGDDEGEIYLAIPESRDPATGRMVPAREARFNNWSMGQLASEIKAPAAYLRQLPAPLAAINLAYGVKQIARDATALVTSHDGGAELRSVQSPTYGRIWDATLVEAVQRVAASGNWQVPAASYASSNPKLATTLYASDRDVFLFLVDPHHPIEVGGEVLFRGFYAWNSETGSASLGLATFLYRYVCDNRNIWGVKDHRELRIRHTSGAPMRLAREVEPQLLAYANRGVADEVQAIQAAQSKEVARDMPGTLSWLASRGFSKGLAERAYNSAERANLNPRSVWGLVQGVTDEAHGVAHADDRVRLERMAGSMLDVATSAG